MRIRYKHKIRKLITSLAISLSGSAPKIFFSALFFLRHLQAREDFLLAVFEVHAIRKYIKKVSAAIFI
jgi:hypothetical protein